MTEARKKHERNHDDLTDEDGAAAAVFGRSAAVGVGSSRGGSLCGGSEAPEFA